MRNKVYLSLAVLLLLTASFTACSNSESPIEQEQQQTRKHDEYTMIINAQKNEDTAASRATRSLSLSGSSIDAFWTAGEKVTVHNDTKNTNLTGSLVAQSSGSVTILSGTLLGTIEAGDVLTLKFLSPNYSGHDGTLTGTDRSIDKVCDYATAKVTVASVNDGVITTIDPASFVNQEAIVRFTLRDGTTLLNPTQLKVEYTDGSESISIPAASYTTNGDGIIYTAIPAISDKSIRLLAFVEGKTYSFEKSSVSFLRGKYYTVNVPMTKIFDARITPLTLESIESGTITFRNKAAGAVTYQINGGDVLTIQSQTTRNISVNAGDIVAFWGNNEKYGVNSTNYQDCSNISCSGDCFIYGNIMSLISSQAYENAKTLNSTYTFKGLFLDNIHLINHPLRKLEMPATTLTEQCYAGLFWGCTGLTESPTLPALTLANSCYGAMFRGCTKITEAPALPAMTLANSCYVNMFAYTNLIEAPMLPAITLTNMCYFNMFSYCENLIDAPELPAKNLAESCYSGMFLACTNLKKAPKLPATTLAKDCYNQMFKKCTGLITAPELPATRLAERCYSSMFNECTNLTNAPELPAMTLYTGCYSFMFQKCTNLSEVPKLPSRNLAVRCYNAMFSQCRKLTETPDLPATNLARECYKAMFEACTLLQKVKCLATNISADNCTSGWLKNVSANGTFIKATGMSGWTRGVNGIPNGWTIDEE